MNSTDGKSFAAYATRRHGTGFKMYYVLRHGEGEVKDLKATLGEVTDLEFFVLMLEHDAHHRGQVATYLRLAGAGKPTGKDWRGLVYGQ